jgi:hypothetical protein
MACYDKKMLWRGNLYISEGAADWNNLNPWTVAQENEWDTTGNGGQCVINPWTRFGYYRVWVNNDWQVSITPQDGYTYVYGGTVEDAVAYTWGGIDNVNGFNVKLNGTYNQKECIQAYYNPANTTVMGDNPAPDDHRDWANWNDTTAPTADATLWDNYLFGIPGTTGGAFTQLNIGGQVYTPYKPSYSWYTQYLLKNYTAINATYSAGLDCAGFIQHSASYTGNSYSLDDIGGYDTWGAYAHTGTKRIVADGAYTWTIAEADWPLIVPGDLVYHTGHVGIVQKISYNNLKRTFLNNNVIIIEATSAGIKSTKIRTLANFIDEGGYFIGRLIWN